MLSLSDFVAKASGITCHSGLVRPGYIFVAIRGRTADGNTFIPNAVAKGAMAIVTDCPDNLPRLDIPAFTVADARLALSELAAAFYSNPSHSLHLVGITGSNGKTTIACMLEHIFSHAGFNTGLIGTIRVNTGRNSFPSTLTTPDAVSVQHYLAQMLDNKVTHAAMEVSAQGIDMKRVAHVRFSTGILTNVCADHLDFHNGFSNYLEAKTKFLDLMSPNTPLIVNIADPYCRTIANQFSGRLITMALDMPATISARISRLTTYSSRFILEINLPVSGIDGQMIPPGKHLCKLSLPGRHNIENATLAAAAALIHGVRPEIIIRALSEFKGVDRRMNVFHINGLTVVDDTALNPGSIEAVFATIASFRYKRLIIVNAIRGRRGPAINAANAAAFATQRRKTVFELIITAGAGHVGEVDTVTDDERLAFLNTLNTLKVNYTYTNTLPGAIQIALTEAAPGDLIALIGAQGMDSGRQVLTSLIRSQPTNLPSFDCAEQKT